jgi:hypothetical protein
MAEARRRVLQGARGGYTYTEMEEVESIQSTKRSR